MKLESINLVISIVPRCQTSRTLSQRTMAHFNPIALCQPTMEMEKKPSDLVIVNRQET